MRPTRPVQIFTLGAVLGVLSACGSEAPGTETVEAPPDAGASGEAAEPSGEDQEASSEEPPTEESSDPEPEDSADETDAAPEAESDDPPEPTDGDNGDLGLGHRTGPGSFDSPLSAGEPIELTNWTIENLEVTPDNTDQFREEMGDLAPTPRNGYVYMRVRADFTRTSDSEEISDSPGFDLTMDLVGGSGELYDDHSNCPSFIDNDWGVLDLSAGETSSGDVCLHVPEDDLDGATLMIDTWWHEEEPLFVALD